MSWVSGGQVSWLNNIHTIQWIVECIMSMDPIAEVVSMGKGWTGWWFWTQKGLNLAIPYFGLHFQPNHQIGQVQVMSIHATWVHPPTQSNLFIVLQVFNPPTLPKPTLRFQGLGWHFHTGQVRLYKGWDIPITITSQANLWATVLGQRMKKRHTINPLSRWCIRNKRTKRKGK